MIFELRATALLLDLDGTLVDSTALITQAWTRWAGEHGLTREDFARVLLHGRPSREIVHDLVPDREDDALRRIEEIELSTPGGVRLLPGADALLRSLGPGGWAVVTSGSQRIAQPRLDALPAPPPVLVTADDVEHGKPDPQPYLLAAQKLGVAEPYRCVVVEDAPAGLEAARRAGMRSIAVVTTTRREDLRATVVVPDLRSVRARWEGGELILNIV